MQSIDELIAASPQLRDSDIDMIRQHALRVIRNRAEANQAARDAADQAGLEASKRGSRYVDPDAVPVAPPSGHQTSPFCGEG